MTIDDMKKLPDISASYRDPLAPLDHAIEQMNQYLAGRGAPPQRLLLELRRDLPYRVMSSTEGDRIIVNREYKPLGWPDKSNLARYEEQRSQHVALSDEAIDRCRHPQRADALFGDECAPWFCRADGRLYLPRLLVLRHEVGRIVAACETPGATSVTLH